MKHKTYESLLQTVPKVADRPHIEDLSTVEGEVMAVLHYLTPGYDEHQYMDVDVYKTRNWKADGSPDLIQHLFKISNKVDGSFNLQFTDSPIYGKDMDDLIKMYSLFPYVYGITPERLKQSVQPVRGDLVH